MNTKDYNQMVNALFIVGIILIIISILTIIFEVYDAMSFCHSNNLSYNLMYTLQHMCNDTPIYRYTNGYDFEKVNLTRIYIELCDNLTN